MIIRLQADLQIQAPLRKLAPRVSLDHGIQWNEEPDWIEIEIPAQPEQVARFLVRSGFEQSQDNPCLWVPLKAPDRGSLKATLIASEQEWEQIKNTIEKLPRNKPLKPLLQMHLEWPLAHPVFRVLRAGDFRLGETIVRLLPEDDQIVVLTPSSLEDIEQLKASGYNLQPLDDWQEEIWWEQMEMGRLLKPEAFTQDGPQMGNPFLTLHGMQNSLAHPVFMRPFLPPLPEVDPDELKRIIRDTIESSTELQLAWDMEEGDEVDVTFQQEYLGFDRDDLDLLLRVHVAMSENLADPYFEIADPGEEEEEEWLSQVFSLLVTASVCGSRFARAELARRGYDTSLEKRLGDRDCLDLASGVLHFTDALYDAIGDSRGAHLWSLERSAARQAEIILDDLLLAAMPGEAILADATYDLYIAFDLGVRYQMARVAPELLDYQPPDNQEDKESTQEHQILDPKAGETDSPSA